MNWLVATSLKLRVLVLALSVVLMVVGIRAARNAPLDVFPEFAPPLVEIQTEAPGLTTDEVEALISVPLENALNGTQGLKTLRSKSVLGLSSVVLIFSEGSDLMRARQLVQERLAVEATRLPAVARPPVILSPLSSTSRLLKIGVSSKVLSQMDLTTLARWTIRPRLMAIPGVANVAIWGQRDRQFQVLVDPDRLRANGVTVDAVTKAVTDASAVGRRRLPRRPEPADRRPAPLADPRARGPRGDGRGDPQRGRRSAWATSPRSRSATPPPIGDAVINDGEGLLLIVEKQPTGNTLEVTRNVEKALDALKPGLKGVDLDPTIFRPATFIERSLENLSEAMWIGLRPGRGDPGPLPVRLADGRHQPRGHPAVADLGDAGPPVDSGVHDQHDGPGRPGDRDGRGGRRRDHRRREHRPPPPAQPRGGLARVGDPVVVYKASIEVRSAVVFASLIVILVFVPIFFLEGLARARSSARSALTYVLAILASLLVALTVTPALSLMLLPGATDRHRESPLVRMLKVPVPGDPAGDHPPSPIWAVVVLVAAFAGVGLCGLMGGLGQSSSCPTSRRTTS